MSAAQPTIPPAGSELPRSPIPVPGGAAGTAVHSGRAALRGRGKAPHDGFGKERPPCPRSAGNKGAAPSSCAEVAPRGRCGTRGNERGAEKTAVLRAPIVRGRAGRDAPPSGAPSPAGRPHGARPGSHFRLLSPLNAPSLGPPPVPPCFPPPRAPRRARPTESLTALGGGGRGPLCAPGPAPVPQARFRRSPSPSSPAALRPFVFFFFPLVFFPPFSPPSPNARIAQPLPDGAPEGLRSPPPHRSPPARSRGRSPNPPIPIPILILLLLLFLPPTLPAPRALRAAPPLPNPPARPGGEERGGGRALRCLFPSLLGPPPLSLAPFRVAGAPRRKGRGGGRACAHPAPRSPSPALRSQLLPSRPAPLGLHPDPPPPPPPSSHPPLRPSRSLIEEPGFLT